MWRTIKPIVRGIPQGNDVLCFAKRDAAVPQMSEQAVPLYLIRQNNSAEHAVSLSAPAAAEAFYRRALALETTPARRMGLGYARDTQGNLEEGRAAFTQALGQFALGNVLAERGDYKEAVQPSAQSIVLAQAAGNLALEVYGHHNLAYHAWLANVLARA